MIAVAAILLLAPLGAAAPVAASCPPLPSSCRCVPSDTGRLSVECHGAVLSTLFKDLGTLPLEHLRIFNCTQPVLDALPLGPIKAIEIASCHIQTIADKIFESVGDSLEELILSFNQLSTMPSFGRLPRLVSLNLQGNKLTNIDGKAMSGLSALKYLRVEDNRICSLSQNALNETKAVELFDMSGNCLTQIPSLGPHLIYLDLSDNKIADINASQLSEQPLLKELRLGGNGLQKLPKGAFAKLSALESLKLDDNRLTSFDGSELPAGLTDLVLDRNLIGTIDTKTLANNQRLEHISIKDNRISQIARNSFDSLEGLKKLSLAGNALTSLDRGMLDGMRRLQALDLHNNSLARIDPSVFLSVPELHSLDLAENQLMSIHKETFAKLPKLTRLDLSENRLRGFEEGTFGHKYQDILISGNQFECDDKFNWFVTYLWANQVRHYLVTQKEVTCAGPARYAGVSLGKLMMRKTNDTIADGMRTLGLDQQGSQKSLISSFIPGFENIQSAANGQVLGEMAAGVPILKTITQAIPSLRSLPGMDIPVGYGVQPQNRDLNGAIEQFTAPLVRFSTGGQPVATDIQQFIESIPNFIVNVPGFGNIDMGAMDPNVVDYILKGGEVPGITKETMDGLIKQAMTNVYEAAAAAQKGNMTDEQVKFLPPLSKLPQQFVANVMKGVPLPGLDANQTKTVTEYYTRSLALVSPNSTDTAEPEMMELWKLLPAGYNISKIPVEVITSVTKGEMPDLKLLPADLLAHFATNADKMTALFKKIKPANGSLSGDVLTNLPKFEKPVLATFSPYDINKLSSEMIHEKEKKIKAEKMRFYTAIVLGVIGVLTVAAIAFFVVYLRKHKRNKTRVASTPPPPAAVMPGSPLASSTMRDPPAPDNN